MVVPALTSTSITLVDTQLYLAAATGALAARIMGGNRELAGDLQGIADEALSSLVNNRIKNRQNLPGRKHAYGYTRRARRTTRSRG